MLLLPGHLAFAAPTVLPFVPGSWTLAILPDTQHYSQSYPDIFNQQCEWIVESKEERNIVYVLHLGDIVNNNTSDQWIRAQRAMRLLDGHVPYAIVPGNHDYGSNGSANNRQTLFNDYFPLSRYSSWPTFGGNMEPNKMDNTYHLFSAGGRDYLILALEWGPRNNVVLGWANSVVSQYPTRQVILITHAYMYFDETRYDWASKRSAQSWNPHAYGTANDPNGTNDGEELWQKLVRRHKGFMMTLNGHVLSDGLGRLSSWGDQTNIVHQMLVNYQFRPLGGEGYMRLIEFLPDGKTAYVKAYSPFHDKYLIDNQNQFILDLDPPPPQPVPEPPPVFQDDFADTSASWEPVQPPATYLAGPMEWHYDLVRSNFGEDSNIFTGAASTGDPSGDAVMLINQTAVPNEFKYKARFDAGDDDALGLIFGYQNETNFYRIAFTRQNRPSQDFPGNGWRVDRKTGRGPPEILFGHGSFQFLPSFVNRAGVPFDVTVSVSNGNLFSLTVVDDPDSQPTLYNLVQNQPLPLLAPAGGRVGLMSWGMNGGIPPGFEASQLSVSSTPAAELAPPSLPGWRSVIPPQASGNTTLTGGNNGTPAWLLSWDASGPSSLLENSGSYALATFSGNNQTDFTGPTLVGGDPSWGDIKVTLNAIPEDSGAFGLLLRYQNPHNFYRVCLSDAAGSRRPPRGLSVQRVVDGRWSELYRETAPQYHILPNTPHQLQVSIEERYLRVRLTLNTGPSPQTFEYDPVQLVDPYLESGQIGLFNWDMSRTVFKSIQVDDTPPLEILSLTRLGDEVTLQLVDRAQAGYTLEFSSALPGIWRPITPRQTGSTWTLNIPPTVKQVFWRLRR